MSHLKFDKEQLVNLEYSLQREMLRTNAAGSYLSTTLSGCNTRKYHGLLICPLNEFSGEKHVLLSSLDETIFLYGSSFNLGIHKYDGDHYEPRGHKYISNFEVNIIPKTTYRVGEVTLGRERLLADNEQQLLVKYTIEDAHSDTILRFSPFLAFRSIHSLSKANLTINTHYDEIENGIKVKLYEGYPFLYMQFSKEVEFVPAPDWYYGIEYPKEQSRGYDYKEDLFVPGYFEVSVKKGESIIFSASTREDSPSSLKQKYAREVKRRTPADSLLNHLYSATRQLYLRKGQQAFFLAGFPWYGPITRQSLIALPGLTLGYEEMDICEKVLDTQISSLKNGLFPKFSDKQDSLCDSIDAPLWFFWTVQQYYRKTKNSEKIWKQYGPAMKSILSAYKNGTDFNIQMLDNGLIYGKANDTALTWMDSYADGKPVVQRGGMPVEVNALWYNAICLALELAKAEKDREFISEWEDLPALVAQSFNQSYWCEQRGYLADCIDGDETDWSVRPNMLIAAALEFSPLDSEQQKEIVSLVKRELLTPRGLRTLSPRDPRYTGNCQGTINERETTIHQGVAWPWFISFFVEAYLKIHRQGGIPFIKKIIEGFEDEMTEHCIGTISEMYDGNPPHKARGAISQAWSVAAVIRSFKILENYEK